MGPGVVQVVRSVVFFACERMVWACGVCTVFEVRVGIVQSAPWHPVRNPGSLETLLTLFAAPLALFGVDVDVIHPVVHPAYLAVERDDTSRRVAWIGRPVRSKGLPFLVEHAARR